MLKLLQAPRHVAGFSRWSRASRWSAVATQAACIRSPTEWGERRAFSCGPSPRRQAAAAQHESRVDYIAPTKPCQRDLAKQLPVVCPGCGAPSQNVDEDAAGYYGSRRATKAAQKKSAEHEEDAVFQNALKSGLLGSSAAQASPTAESPSTPICDRCHYLLYQSKGESIIHPSMQSIQQIIEESPHKHNHIYHVLDAADFPMSLIPNLVSALKLPRLRTQNRRSKSMHFVRGRVAEVSFIITRSDLLAPKKEQVDAMLPYLREVLREALGRQGRGVRLGNVRCVSAQRGWWTKTVKEEIYGRGGAGWVVGKVNVGKSALFETVFPKGRNQEDVNIRGLRQREESAVLVPGSAGQAPSRSDHQVTPDGLVSLPSELDDPPAAETRLFNPDGFQESELQLSGRSVEEVKEDEVIFDDASLLPPAQPETAFPRMPIVSSLPGTTASPIRIPFGNGKGELIDLPGVHRSDLDTLVDQEHRGDLIMKSRLAPEQLTIKPGQSLLLGGLIRITPKTDTLITLAYPFVPLHPHVTSTYRAIGIQTGTHPDGEPYTGTVSTIATPSAKAKMAHAGTFPLEWDVTKRRSGPLTTAAAGKQKAANLPFTIWGADMLVEGVGWVEITCQVRRRRPSFVSKPVIDAFSPFGSESDEAAGSENNDSVSGVPEIDVYSPEGKYVAVRRPMNAWVVAGPKQLPKHKRRGRGRMSINFEKRKEGGRRGGMLAN